jgi:N-glycosylase/DNA lyase
MDKLIKQIEGLRKSSIRKTIDNRLKEFESFKHKTKEEWFSELCFCLLTANSKAVTALNIQDELHTKGFCGYCQRDISKTIKKHKHRFHNNKAEYIVNARCHIDIRDKIKIMIKEKNEFEAREWLVKNIKGLGYKEASHFLRNVGYKNLAILDRHIINLLFESKKIKQKPKSVTKKHYLEIEKVFKKIADKLNMSLAKLDLYMWYIKTGKILK